MKITLFDMDPWECGSFKPLEQEHEVQYEQQPLRADNAGSFSDSEVVSVFIYSRLGADTLKQLPRLKMIATRSTGFDHIDLDYCEQNGITVANVPTYGENTVAEHVFALMLALSHRLVEATDRTRRGDFTPEGLQGFDLRCRTLGVIGTGNIGRHVIQIARGFGMQVLAADLEPDDELAEQLGFEYVPQQQLLEQSHIVTLHVPGGEATRDLIDAQAFSAMREGAVLINTSRGAVVNVQALLHALAEGRLAGAGLDVLPEEPVIREEAELLHAVFSEEHDLRNLLADHVLLHMNNVVITPHSAFNTEEAVQRILDTTRDNIEDYVAGRHTNSVVDAG